MAIEIVFHPGDRPVHGEEGDTLLEVALEHDIPLEHACGGDAVCSTCAVCILKGGEHLSEMEEEEEDTLQKLLPKRPEGTRLACQAKIGAILVSSEGIEVSPLAD